MAVRLRRIWQLVIIPAVVVYVLILFYALMYQNPRCRIDMPSHDSMAAFADHRLPKSKTCHVNLDELGPVTLDLSLPNLTQIEQENTMVHQGGKWSPTDCSPWQKVAIMVPYRDRWHHLLILLRRLHPMLQRQKISYQIFVIEQEGTTTFNKGRLYNTAVVETLKQKQFDCFIFHDVDMLPENDKNLYYCDQHLHHLSPSLDEMRYHVMYCNLAGGVVALNYKNIYRVNGFSNEYWGWGGEDDDLSARTMESGLLMTLPPDYIGRYKMIRHIKRERANNVIDVFLTWRSRWRKDGLNSLNETKCKVKHIREWPLYTHILVDVGQAPAQPPDLKSVPHESSSWLRNFYS